MIQGTYTFFNEGFFGYSKEQDFTMFSFWHFLPIILMIIAIVVIYKNKEKILNWKYESAFRFIFSFIMLMVEMSYFWRSLYDGNQSSEGDLMDRLPIQICQWGLIISSFMMMSKNKILYSISYFITLIFAPIALVYPKVISVTGPTYYRYYQFWLEHCMPIIAVFYMKFVYGYRPTYKGLLCATGILAVIAILCAFANAAFPEADYLYVSMLPLPIDQSLKILILSIPAFGIFNLLYFIQKFIHRKEKDNELILEKNK